MCLNVNMSVLSSNRALKFASRSYFPGSMLQMHLLALELPLWIQQVSFWNELAGGIESQGIRMFI